MTQIQTDPDAATAAQAAEPARLANVAESIKYRRRAQQAEGQLQDLAQQLQDLQAQLDARSEEIASAEAQRDEARQQITELHNRLAVERTLGASGVTDVETATVLLGKRLDLGQELSPDALGQAVEQLLLDKPLLRHPTAMPPKTASPRAPRATAAAQLADAAQRAARSGDRRDVAEYLRLRRVTARQ